MRQLPELSGSHMDQIRRLLYIFLELIEIYILSIRNQVTTNPCKFVHVTFPARLCVTKETRRRKFVHRYDRKIAITDKFKIYFYLFLQGIKIIL